MGTPNPYPRNLKVRVHKLYYVDGWKMTAVLPVIRAEFPNYADRVTVGRLHSVARDIRKEMNLPAKVAHQSEAAKKREAKKGGDKITISKMQKNTKEQVIAKARELHKKNYRWGAITEELKLEFPDVAIPGPGPLANLVKGKKPKKENKNNKYQIAITGPSGVTLNMTVSSSKSWERILQNILEV